MKHFIIIFSIIFPIFANAQVKKSTCDENILTSAELQKCKSDSIFEQDIEVRINYIISLKTSILPKYRAARKKIVLDEDIAQALQSLKESYDKLLNIKLNQFEQDADKNALYVQPKSYVVSLLSHQIFKFYPDVYAIMLNPIHLMLRPKTTSLELENYLNQINSIYSKIPLSKISMLNTITEELREDKLVIANGLMMESFQGEISEAERKKYDIINFLIWSE